MNQLKFELISREIESLISAYKHLTDKCLIKTEQEDRGIVLSPELSRALNKSTEHCWCFVDSEEIGAILNPNTEEDVGSSLLEIDNFDSEQEEKDVDHDDLMLQIS